MTTPPIPRTLAVSSIHLAAVLTAVSLSREFIGQTLRHWQLDNEIDRAELVASELVTNAVKETGITEPSPTWEQVKAYHIVGVQLRLVGDSLYVEVWDRSSGSPVIPEQSLDAEGGRGLFLVDSLSRQWDIYRPSAGGKVVWAELALSKSVQPSLHIGERSLWDLATHDRVAGTEMNQAKTAFMRRVLGGVHLELSLDVQRVAV